MKNFFKYFFEAFRIKSIKQMLDDALAELTILRQAVIDFDEQVDAYEKQIKKYKKQIKDLKAQLKNQTADDIDE